MSCYGCFHKNGLSDSSRGPENVFLSKTVQPQRLCFPGTATYSIIIENYSPVVITDVSIEDHALLSFFSISNIRLNGCPVPDAQNLVSGVFVPFMPPLSCSRVTFDARLLPGAACRVATAATASYHNAAVKMPACIQIRSDEAVLDIVTPGRA